jgi:hypothetical protein
MLGQAFLANDISGTDASQHVFIRIAIDLERQRRPAIVPRAVLRRRTDARTNVLLEALKSSGPEQRDDPRFPSKKPPALARVPAADPKSKAHASRRAESTRFGKGLRGLSGCGTSTNLFIAVYSQHD